MTKVDETARVVRAEQVLSAEVDGDVVLLSLEENAYFGSGDVGRAIWRRIEEPITVADLVTSLQEEYDVDRATCRRDVVAFLEELVASSLAKVT